VVLLRLNRNGVGIISGKWVLSRSFIRGKWRRGTAN